MGALKVYLRFTSVSGAFTGTGTGANIGYSGEYGYSDASFSAATYNSIYSDSVTTVQPSARQALIIIKA